MLAFELNSIKTFLAWVCLTLFIASASFPMMTFIFFTTFAEEPLFSKVTDIVSLHLGELSRHLLAAFTAILPCGPLSGSLLLGVPLLGVSALSRLFFTSLQASFRATFFGMSWPSEVFVFFSTLPARGGDYRYSSSSFLVSRSRICS